MNLFLDNRKQHFFNVNIVISGSKSESNRLLILQQIFKNLSIKNLSNSKDTQVLQAVLSSTKNTFDIGHAGTAMRFLTAYLSLQKGVFTLTGSNRMQNRPIQLLVNTLRDLGADIRYLEKEGFPPIQIKGKDIVKNKVSIAGNISSQYITALLLIAPSLKNGLHLTLTGKVTSIPYIKMTLSLLQKIGVETEWVENRITIHPKEKIKNTSLMVESDWSSASYFYSLVALSKNGKCALASFTKESLQGDKELITLYEQFGVQTRFEKDTIILEKVANYTQKKHLTFNLVKTPDIAQTIAVTCFGLGVSCDLTGLHTLKIKETDRLEALKIELGKMGAEISITEDSFHLKVSNIKEKMKLKDIIIHTYDDHRMAMAFAPLSLLFPITIQDANVVHKSYPNFWNDLNKLKN